MTAKRVDMHRLQELVRLHRLGTKSAREVARLLKMGRTTEWTYRKALDAAGLLRGDPEELPDLATLKAALNQHSPTKTPKQQVSTVEPWRADVEKMLERGAQARAIYDRLRLDHKDEFGCSESAVKRFCARLREEKGIAPEDVAIPVETLPGKVAQVDFGYVGKMYDPERGTRRKAWVFVMTLGFSRRPFACLTFDQKIETWLTCHILAFEHFGGVPETIVPDNLKSAVIRCAFGVDDNDDDALNRSYRELARHYGFTIDPTPPSDPRKKGKVESDVKYVKRNFFLPRDLDEMGPDRVRAELSHWLTEIADVRVHGATRERPIDRFEREEKGALKPLPPVRFESVVWKQAKVHPDSHVVFDKRMYSVPFELIGKRVWIRATPTTVVVYANDERVATHSRRSKGYRSTNDHHLPEHRASRRHRSRDFWEQRARHIGPETERLVAAVFDSEDVASKLRVAQSIVTHLEQFPTGRANAASRRALHFGNLTYGGIKDILRQGLDYEPLPGTKRKNGVLEHPRFSRSPTDLIDRHIKKTNS